MSARKKSKPVVLGNSPEQEAANIKAKITVTEIVGNYEKHPFFVKKANAAKELLRKVGLPEDFKAKTN